MQRKKKNNILVEIDSPLIDTIIAMEIIKKLLKINKIEIDLSIAYDYNLEECGVYLPFERGQKFRIFVNPSKCVLQKDIDIDKWEEDFFPGYSADLTLMGITIHEFCHLLQYQVYKNILDDFQKEFPTERFYINSYANNEIWDELAEIMTLYITNPYLLKLISEEHYKFLKKYFKSPVPCTFYKCQFIYQGFPISIKEHMKKKWKITYDVNEEEFVRLNDGKV